MELVTKKINTYDTICRNDMQITLEEDINVPDSKPDAEKIIKTHGDVIIDSVTPSEDKITLQGKLSFQILYGTTEDLRPVHNIKGQIPFQETLNMDGLEANEDVSCHFELEDCQSSLINSRKINVRALVNFNCCQEIEKNVNAGINIVSPEASKTDMTSLAPPDGLHCLTDNFTVTNLISQNKDVFRVRDEFSLPKGKPNIDTILYYEIIPQNIQNRIVEDGIRFLGDMKIFLLYVPENEDRRLEFYETELPFDGIVHCDGCSENMVSDIEFINSQKSLESKPDEDGENRILEIDYHLNLRLRFYEDETFSRLKDAYSTACTLSLDYQPVKTTKLLMKNQSVVRISDRIKIDEDMTPILQICSASGTVQIDEQNITTEGISIEGAVSLDILYITEDDDHPVSIIQGTLPFSHTIEIKGISPTDDYELQSLLNGISVIMLDSTEIEVKVILEFCAFVFTHENKQVITALHEAPLDMEKIQSMPGLVGFISDGSSSMWDIAKQYNTTVESIMALNSLDSDVLHAGDRLLLVKQIDLKNS